MMRPEDITKLAHLARLRLEPKETETLADEASRILEFVAELQELNTDDISPMTRAEALVNVFREDRVESADADTVNALTSAFPERRDEYNAVKNVFGHGVTD